MGKEARPGDLTQGMDGPYQEVPMGQKETHQKQFLVDTTDEGRLAVCRYL